MRRPILGRFQRPHDRVARLFALLDAEDRRLKTQVASAQQDAARSLGAALGAATATPTPGAGTLAAARQPEGFEERFRRQAALTPPAGFLGSFEEAGAGLLTAAGQPSRFALGEPYKLEVNPVTGEKTVTGGPDPFALILGLTGGLQGPKVPRVPKVGAAPEAGAARVPGGVPEEGLPAAAPEPSTIIERPPAAPAEPPRVPPEGPPAGVPPEPPIDPLNSLTQKLSRIAKLDKRELTPLVKAERRIENIERTAAFRRELDGLLGEGVPFDEAINRARGKFAGKRFDIVREGFEITAEEEAAFNNRLLSIPVDRTYTLNNVHTAVWEGAAGRRLRNWEINAIREVLGDDFAKAIGTIGRKASEEGFDPMLLASDLLTAPVTARSTLDASFYLRQGWKTAPRHPKEWLSSLRQGAVATRSERGFQKIDAMILGDDFLVPVGNATEQELRPLGELIQTKEFDIHRVLPDAAEAADRAIVDERVMSRLVTHVPGVRASARNFVGGGNWLRYGVGKKLVQNAMARNLRRTGTGFITPHELDELASVVRRGSGLGEIGQKVSWLRELVRHVMWAPGLRTSGPQLLWRVLDPRGVVLPGRLPVLGRGTPWVARQAAAEMVGAWFGTGATMMGLAAAAGMAVELNPFSTNFGTIGIPGTRAKVNIWGPEQNLARTIARAIKGEGVDEFGNTRPITPDKAATEYFISGLNPALSDIKAIYEGRTYDKELSGWNRESALRFLENEMPIFLQDVKRTWELDGPIVAAGATPYYFLGGSAQVYSETGGRFRAIPKWNTADINVVKTVFPDAPEALNLAANEERELLAVLDDVKTWLNDLEEEFGQARPADVPYETFITAYGRKHGLEARRIVGAIFLHKAKGRVTEHPELLNPAWVQFALEHEDELGERDPDLFRTQYIDVLRQRAREAELIPAQ